MEAIAERTKQRIDIWPFKYSIEATPQHYEITSPKAAAFTRYIQHVVPLRRSYYLSRLYLGDVVVVEVTDGGTAKAPQQLVMPLWWHSVEEVQTTFESLAGRWEQETGAFSTIIDKVTHPAYQRIIGLGPAAIPLILRRIRERPGYWFWALEALTGVDPAQDADGFDTAVGAWLRWGRGQRFID
jgi:hypothetical protein